MCVALLVLLKRNGRKQSIFHNARWRRSTWGVWTNGLRARKLETLYYLVAAHSWRTVSTFALLSHPHSHSLSTQPLLLPIREPLCSQLQASGRPASQLATILQCCNLKPGEDSRHTRGWTVTVWEWKAPAGHQIKRKWPLA